MQYITRQGPYRSQAEGRVRHQGLEAGSERVREDLVYWRFRNAPSWAKDDPVRYFAAAEARERVKGVAYTEWRFNVPREMTRREQMACARDVLQGAFGDAHPYCWALHDARAADGGRNVHVHVLWSARMHDGLDRTEEQFFRRYNAAHPERGGARKDPELNHMGAVKASRVQYVDIVNVHLEHGGYPTRLHPDSLAHRGIRRDPEPKLLPSDSTAYKRGVITSQMQTVLDHRAARAQTAEVELADAQTYWRHRQYELGIHRDMPLAQQLEHIRQAREQAITQAPARVPAHELALHAHELERNITGLERYVNDLQREQTTEQWSRMRSMPRDPRSELRVERLLAEGNQHGLPRDVGAERAVAQHGRVLGSLEQEQDRSMGMGF